MPASLLSKELIRAKVLLGKAYDYNKSVAEAAAGSGDVQDVIAKVVGSPVPSEYKDPRDWAQNKAQEHVKTAGLRQLGQAVGQMYKNVRTPSTFKVNHKRYKGLREAAPNPASSGYHYPDSALFDAATEGLDAAQRKALSRAWRTGTYTTLGGSGLYLGDKMYQAANAVQLQTAPTDQLHTYLDQQGTY